MAYIVWQGNFSTKVPQIDDQHKTLIAMINRLERSAASESASEEIAAVLTELVQYTRKHFADEERYMRHINYFDYDRHKKLHGELINSVVDILQRLKADHDLNAFELLSFLKDWLINHILAEDRKIGRATVISAR